MELKVKPSGHDRYTYYRCSNRPDEQYTCVALSNLSQSLEGQEWLKQHFENVAYISDTLPAYRLFDLTQ